LFEIPPKFAPRPKKSNQLARTGSLGNHPTVFQNNAAAIKKDNSGTALVQQPPTNPVAFNIQNEPITMVKNNSHPMINA
jgi:hypothetical protein